MENEIILLKAISAIKARINGEYDAPELDGMLLSDDTEGDIMGIIEDAESRFNFEDFNKNSRNKQNHGTTN
jgi:hypothetical protein